jgi:flagellar FliL protein
MSEAAEEKAPAAPAGIPMKMVIIIVAGVLVLGVRRRLRNVQDDERCLLPTKRMAEGGAREGKPRMARRKRKAGEHGAVADASAIADLDPFIVNLADSPEIRYLKVTLKVEADGSGHRGTNQSPHTPDS